MLQNTTREYNVQVKHVYFLLNGIAPNQNGGFMGTRNTELIKNNMLIHFQKMLIRYYKYFKTKHIPEVNKGNSINVRDFNQTRVEMARN